MKKIKLAETTKDPEILDELSQDKDPDVRYWVVYNPNTKPETLEYLSHDKDSDVRWCVVENRNTKPETLEENLIMQIKNDIINSLTEKEKQIYEIK